ncbi:MAG: hypothetical protein [Microviridae sp.]|nr:MAG: hypothetical protein [Microviridae sp.]
MTNKHPLTPIQPTTNSGKWAPTTTKPAQCLVKKNSSHAQKITRNKNHDVQKRQRRSAQLRHGAQSGHPTKQIQHPKRAQNHIRRIVAHTHLCGRSAAWRRIQSAHDGVLPPSNTYHTRHGQPAPRNLLVLRAKSTGMDQLAKIPR